MNTSEKLLLLEAENIAYRKWIDSYFKFVEAVVNLQYGFVNERVKEWLTDERDSLQQIRTRHDLLLGRVPKHSELHPGKN